MMKQLKYAWIIFRNVIILLLVLELILGAFYNYKSNKKYDEYIDLKIEAKVHGDMNAEEVRALYYEYLELEMKWTPYTHFSPMPYNGIYNTVDSLGHRKTIQHTTNKNAIRIFCFGGSTMYGIGATDKTTIPSLLSLELSKKFPNKNFMITNFGIGGYTRDQEIIQLQQELLKGHVPDVVIFYDGVNEVLSGFQSNDIGIPQNAQNRRLEFNSAKTYSKKIQLLTKSSNVSRLINYLKSSSNNKKYHIETKSLSKKIASNYSNHIKYSDALSEKYNFKILSFLQPTIFSKKVLSDYESIMKKNEGYLEDIYNSTYEELIKDSTLIQSKSYVDISTIFNSTTETVFTDFCHTAEKGNIIIANELIHHLDISIFSISKDSLN